MNHCDYVSSLPWAYYWAQTVCLSYRSMYRKYSSHTETRHNKENPMSWQDGIQVYEPPDKYVPYASWISLCVSLITETASIWHLNSEGCLHASITASAKSVAPAPPSAQCLQTTARKAPLSKLACFISSHSASVSVLKHISQHFWMKFINDKWWYTVTTNGFILKMKEETNQSTYVKELMATTTGIPNFLPLLMCFWRFGNPLASSSRFS